MEIKQSQEGGVRVLAIIGAFDSTNIETFDAHITEAVDTECVRVLVDTEHLRFINSTALGSLIRAQKRLNEYGGDLAVCALPGFVSGVFKTLGLDRKIQCFGAKDEAVAYLHTVGDECVDVPGAEDLGFLFVGAEQVAIAGEEPRNAILQSLSDQRLTFRWENDEGPGVAAVMAPGARLQVRFMLKLFQPTYVFDMLVDVESAVQGTGSDFLVTARVVEVADVERRVIQQFVRDMRLLGGEDSGDPILA